jgi:hypothetical protein
VLGNPKLIEPDEFWQVRNVVRLYLHVALIFSVA